MQKVRQANVMVLGILGVILGLVVIDYGRQAFFPKKGAGEPKAAAEPPAPKVGEIAPDFSLPDATAKVRSLAEMVKGDTLLWFTCGCAQCREAQKYMRALEPRLKRKWATINVTTAPREAEAAYRRNIKLAQSILYEQANLSGGVQKRYQGHPCPRIYALTGDRKIEWISRSLSEGIQVVEIAMGLAEFLGFSTPGEKVAGKPTAPTWNSIVEEAAPSSMGIEPAETDLHAGHDHGPGVEHGPGPKSGPTASPSPGKATGKAALPPYMAPLPEFAKK